MQNITHVFFDVGYTLINEDAVWETRCREQAETPECQRLGLSADDIFQAIVKASLAHKPQYRTVVNTYQLQEVAPYRHDLERLYHDAERVLQPLSGHYTLGVIANQTDGLAQRLEAYGIRSYFTHIISSWDHQVMKPDPRLFEIALQEAGCPPNQALMVGDRLDNDILPAKSVGMKTIWIRQGFGGMQTIRHPSEEPDATVSSLSELLPLLFSPHFCPQNNR